MIYIGAIVNPISDHEQGHREKCGDNSRVPGFRGLPHFHRG